jgi:hypothetical protein
MSGLLERHIGGIASRVMLVAPPQAAIPAAFGDVLFDARKFEALVHEAQRLRGGVYVRDGAVRSGDLKAGRHITPEDDRSWHLLMLNGHREITGCIWYREHESRVPLKDLRVHASPVALDAEWRSTVRRVIERDQTAAAADGIPYAEVGGWAVSDRSNCPAEGFLLALAAYSLSRALGGALGYTTATVRHSSSRILRRLGLEPFAIDGTHVPGYFDHRYGCEMELLRFDSRESNPRYHTPIEMLKRQLATAPVVSAAPAAREAAVLAGRPALVPVFAA